MHNLTVVMVLRRPDEEIKETITSILNQQGVDLELIVAGVEPAKDIVQSFHNSRLHFWAGSSKDKASFYNATMEKSTAPFFATIEPSVVLLPGALERLLTEFSKESDAAIVHPYFFKLDEHGEINRDQFRKKRERFEEMFGPEADYWSSVVTEGERASGHFRIYRSSLFTTAGRFRENTKLQPDFEFALRVADSGCIRVIPEHLYTWKHYPSRYERFRLMVNWIRTSRYVLNRNRPATNVFPLLFSGFNKASGLNWIVAKCRWLLKWVRSRNRKMRSSVLKAVYEKILIRLPSPSIGSVKSSGNSTVPRRIAYYIWHFPVLSQTFVNRELLALKKSGIPLCIIADESEDLNLADENARTLLNDAKYILPFSTQKLRQYKRDFFLRSPLLYMKLLLFIITHQYGPFKNLSRDLEVFSKAVYLAGILEEEKITHLHSPWTDRCAFLSFLASRILNITYSVQARAHEVHRKFYLYGLRENLENARFVVTNSEYNKSYLRSIVRERFTDRILKIYNGIDLDRFHPSPLKSNQSEKIQLLSVARLIEQKGILFLLKACRILKDDGIPFHLEIVGGPEEELFVNYLLQIRKLHRDLDLPDSVTFSGVLPFDQVLKRYERSDLFLLPSVIGKDGSRDITPNALLEAMAMKLPVIATTVTAIPEIIDHGKNGLLIEPENENALADAMKELIQNPELRRHLGENARSKIEERFDISQNVRQYVELFSS